MNEPSNNPITGPGMLWAIGQINQRFDRELSKLPSVPAAKVEASDVPSMEPQETKSINASL